MANKFSDINSLSIYVSADPGESTINKTGTDVNSVTTGSEGSADPFTINDIGGTTKIQHDPATIKCGQMAAFQNTNGSDATIRGEFTPQTAQGDYTIVITFQIDVSGANRIAEFVGGSGSTANDMSLEYSSTGNAMRARANGTLNTSANLSWVQGQAHVAVLRWNNASGGTGLVEMWLDNVKDTSGWGAISAHAGTTGGISLLNRWTGTAGVGGRVGLVAYYDRLLTDPEVTEIYDLAKYWIDNGEAPSTGPPTTVTFGPVATNDDPSVTTWNWEASADGGATWDEAENVLSDVSGEATTSLVVNSAALAENGTQVRCRAISAKEPAGVESAVATLTVQAAS